MIFDYNKQPRFMSQVQIDDIGCTSLRCIGDMGAEYYLVINTVMGMTRVLGWGPTVPDTHIISKSFAVKYKILKYKESAVEKEIDSFINDPFKGITDVEEVMQDEAFETMPLPEDYIRTMNGQ